jgi:hypothetical protein
MNRASAASIGAFIVATAIVAIANHGLVPNPEAAARERSCKTWGVTEAAVLAKCREGADQERAAIAPFEHAAVDREIAWFNEELSALASGRTRANESDYPSLSLQDASEKVGGSFGWAFGQVDNTTFPALGQPVKLVGVIVSDEPDQDDPQRFERYFTVGAEMQPPPAGQKTADNPEMPLMINLDIESSNRHERQFITDHCRPAWVTPCRATVFGHFNEIVGRRHSSGLGYIGIVADQVNIEPLNWSTARPGWMLSARSLPGGPIR